MTNLVARAGRNAGSNWGEHVTEIWDESDIENGNIHPIATVHHSDAPEGFSHDDFILHLLSYREKKKEKRDE